MLAGKIRIEPEGGVTLKPFFELLPQDYLRVGVEDERWHATLPVTRRIPKGGSLALRLPKHKTPKAGTPVFLIDRREPELMRIVKSWQARLESMEFYPDEGKYHLDGHRACNVVLEPKDSLALGNICPVCGKPLTVGVLHRVLELADREAAPVLAHEPEARPLIPLAEVVGELLGVGPSSRKVRERYGRLLRELGPELDILCRMPEAEIRAHWEPLGEAVARMSQTWLT